MYDAKFFHPMKGCVHDNAEVRFTCGDTITIKSGMYNWLIMSEGKVVEVLPLDAYAVDNYIFRREHQ